MKTKSAVLLMGLMSPNGIFPIQTKCTFAWSSTQEHFMEVSEEKAMLTLSNTWLSTVGKLSCEATVARNGTSWGSFGRDNFAFTGKRQTSYSFTLPADDIEIQETIIRYFSDLLNGKIDFLPEEVEQEKQSFCVMHFHKLNDYCHTQNILRDLFSGTPLGTKQCRQYRKHQTSHPRKPKGLLSHTLPPKMQHST